MIEINSVSFSRGDHKIFQGFSAEISLGESVLLTGPNGTGKSTLIQLIGGLLKPNVGSVKIDGIDIKGLSAKEQALLRSIAPQRRIFTLAFTVEQVMNFLPRKMRVEDSSYLVKQLGITEILTKKVTELSIGQQERVSLALAISQRANYYLLDEPFSAQDSESTARILELIIELKKKKGVLVISHNQDAIASQFDQVISLA